MYRTTPFTLSVSRKAIHQSTLSFGFAGGIVFALSFVK